MLFNVSLLTLLCLLGALQGVLLAVAIGSVDGGSRRSNRLLAGIVLGAVAVMVVVFLSHRQGGASDSGQSGLELVEYSLWAFAGPLLLLYVSLVAGGDEWPPASFALHFVPGAVWLAYVALCLVGLAIAPRLPPVLSMMLYQVAYTLLAVRLWYRYRSGRSPDSRPSACGLHSFWVPALLGVLFLQHVAQLVRWSFRHVPALRDIVPLTVAGSFVVLTLFGLRKALPLLSRSGRRYASSTLTAERSEALAKRIEKLMERDRPYLQLELTLENLAVALEIPKTHLSQVLNENLGHSFLDYLSGYRVRESLRLLTDENASHLTIEAVARRSGFNSRSAFYEAFRRHQGVTPTDFRRQARRD